MSEDAGNVTGQPEDLPLNEGDWELMPESARQLMVELWTRVQGLQKDEQRQEAEVARPTIHQGQCVLVVDDSPLVRKTVSNILKRWGHRLVEAEDGEQALAVARAQRPDIIVLDVNMPKKNGIETLQELRQEEAFRETPVIMLTSETDRRTVAQAAGGKVSGYIIKGTQDEMRRRLAKFLAPR